MLSKIDSTFTYCNKMIKYSLLILQLLLLNYTLHAQSVNFNHITVENGLTNNSILAITQDKIGFMWFGSGNGLIRYDGINFKTYKKNKTDINTLPGNYIISILSDSKNTLWIGSEFGLSIYNNRKDNVERITLENGVNPIIYSLLEDKEGKIWVGTSNGLYISIQNVNGEIKSFNKVKNNTIVGNIIRSIYQDKTGKILIGTNNGLTIMYKINGEYKYENFQHQSQNLNSLSGNYITTITEDNDNFWIGTQNNGITLLKYKNKIFKRIGKNNLGPEIINNNIRIIKARKNGEIWIGTQEGISVISSKNKKNEFYQNETNNKQSLNQNSIYSLYEDNNDNLWIGTYFGGVNLVYSKNTNFNILQNQNNQTSLSNNVISSIVEDKLKNLWIGTEGGGLNYYNRINKSFTIYKNKNNDNFSLGSNLVKTVYIDKDDNVWTGTHGGGLNVFNKKNNKFKRYLFIGNNSITQNSEITSIIEDDKNVLWVASNKGLYNLKRNGIDLKEISKEYIEINKKLSYPKILFKDRNNDIYIAAENGLFKKEGKELSLISNESNINCLLEDINGNIWIGSNNGGLRLYNTLNKNIYKYSHADILTNRNILGLLEDELGNIWISTDNGLMKYNQLNKTFKVYNKSDGLIGKQFNYNSYLKDTEGRLYFGGYNGIVNFLPSQIESNENKAPIIFTNLKLFNNSVAINEKNGLLKKNINDTKLIEFKNDQNIFTIEFSLLNYIKSEKNSYAYKLAGFDKSWNLTKDNSVTFSNLSAGNYTLWVKGANNDGIWSHPISLKIKILPPIWLTFTAYCIYSILLIVLLFFITRFIYLKALIKKEDELNKNKINFFTNVSHEIRTHLTLIMTPLEGLIDKSNKDVYINHQLQQVKNNSNRLLKLVNELMDFRKTESQTLKLKIKRKNIIPLLYDIFDSFKEIAILKNIKISFLHDLEEIILYFDEEQLEKVFFNLLTNAIKFTPRGGSICLQVKIKDNKVTITVSDNGKGIAPEYINNLFTNFFQVADHGIQNTGYGIGLALSKNIISLHQGNISVESEYAMNNENGKTTFTVTLFQGNKHFEKTIHLLEQAEIQNSNGTIPNDWQNVDNSIIIQDVTDNHFVILIAEDNVEIRNLIHEHFCKDYNIVLTENGLEAWEQACEIIPDIIISDVMMPIMDGFTLCEKIKSDNRTSHIPVVLLTAKNAEKDQITGLETGADIYISKPFSIKILELSIRNIIQAREKLRHKFNTQLVKLHQQEIVPNSTDHLFINTVERDFLVNVINIIESHLDDPEFGVDKLAKKVAMSTPILYKKIKAVSNMSVNDFVKSIRLKKGAQLLLEKTLTINEVSFTVGFNDRKYFSREFKKQYGVNPKDYVSNNNSTPA